MTVAAVLDRPRRKRYVPGPGVYDGLEEAVYHADPVRGGSLSSTGARALLPPKGCPAKYRYEQDHPRVVKKEFDFGKAAHRLLLGVGPELVELDHLDMRTNAAKADAAECRDAGQIPLLPDDMAIVLDMAAALVAEPMVMALFDLDQGYAEQSLFWVDARTDVIRRARLDYLGKRRDKYGRLIVPEYKTAKSAEPGEWMRSAVSYGYHQQGAWYVDAVRGVGLADEVVFLFVVQEKVAPYVTSVIELPPEAMMWGGLLNEYALDIYRHCVTHQQWPGYTYTMTPRGFDTEISMPPFPKYAEYAAEETLKDMR